MSEQLQQPKTSDLENYRPLYNEFIGVVEQMQKTFLSFGNAITRLGNEIDGLKQEVGYLNQEIVGLNQEIEELKQKDEEHEKIEDVKSMLSLDQPQVRSDQPQVISDQPLSKPQKEPLKIAISYDATPGPNGGLIYSLDPIAKFLRTEFNKENIPADVSLCGLMITTDIQKLKKFDLVLFVARKPTHNQNELSIDISTITKYNPNLYWLFVDCTIYHQHPPVSDLTKTWGSYAKGNLVFYFEKNSFSEGYEVCRRALSKQNDNSMVCLKHIIKNLYRI